MTKIDYLILHKRLDGKYEIFYPDEGWIACADNCTMKHKHDVEQKMVKSNLITEDYKESRKWAEFLAEGREIKETVAQSPIGKKKDPDSKVAHT